MLFKFNVILLEVGLGEDARVGTEFLILLDIGPSDLVERKRWPGSSPPLPATTCRYFRAPLSHLVPKPHSIHLS